MAQQLNSKADVEQLPRGISPADYDFLRSIVEPRVQDPELVNEYVGAYIQVAAQLNLRPSAFAQLLQEQGSDLNQDLFLAGFLNQNRVANARLGVALDLSTPEHIRREIRA